MSLYANEEGYEIITFCCLERSDNEKFMKSGYVYDPKVNHKIGKLNFRQRGGM